MKQSVQKSNNLSLVPNEPRSYEAAKEEKARTLIESFDGWLDAVAPTLLKTTAADDRPNIDERWRRTLSFADVTRVSHATVREGTDHRHWPPDVVLSFLAAEVIKRRK